MASEEKTTAQEQDRERARRRERRDAWSLATVDRHRKVLDDIVARAVDPTTWAAARRQAASYRRHLATWQASPAYESVSAALGEHADYLEATIRTADAQLAEVDPEERAAALRNVGVRVAIIGKGGAGKTVLSSTVARLLGRRGRQVLAVDLDTNPGMSYSIGLRGGDISLPDDAVESDLGAAYGWQLRTDLLPREIVERYTVAGPDGVAVTALGKIGDLEKEAAKKTVTAVVQLLLDFGEPGWDVVADLEAGPTTPFERYHAFADHVILVVGPAWRSAMTARRLLPMVGEGRTTTIVANRFRDEPDHPGLTPDIRIPFDPEVAEAERQGLSPLDVCPGSPTIEAIQELVQAILEKPLPEMEVAR